MKRERVTTTLTLPPDLKQWLRRTADAKNRTMGEILEDILVRFRNARDGETCDGCGHTERVF